MAADHRRGRLVGRSRELDELGVERRRSEHGELRVALVLGGPGLGKSRLAAELGPSGDDDAIHLAARSSRLRPLPPFRHWVDTLHRSLGTSGTVHGKGWMREEWLAEHVVSLLGLVSARRPVTMVLDDVHWAEESVWEMLLRLAQDLPDGRVFVLATARPRELAAQAAAADALIALDQQEVVHRIELGLLARSDLEEMAVSADLRWGARLPALVDWLVARSQGNPRLAVGLIEPLAEDDADPHALAVRSMPQTLVRWVVAEAARLGPRESRLLELLAVVGKPIDPGDLAQLAERSQAEVATTLEGLLRSGLVVEHEHDHSLVYRIAHPIVGDMLYAQVAGATRRVLHRRVAGVLLAAGQSAAAAYHLIRSARVGDAQAVDALIRELRRADPQGSHADVWAVLPALIDLLPAGDDRWLEVSDALSWPCSSSLAYKAERYTSAEMGALLKIQEQVARAGDMTREASIRFRRAGYLAYGAGDKDSGQLECRHALELSREAGRDHEFRMAAIELAKMRGWFGDLRGQERAARQLLAQAEEAGDQRGIVAALGAFGVALALQGRFREAEGALLRCVDLASSTETLPSRPQAGAILAVLGAMQGHTGAARTRWPKLPPGPGGQIWSSEVFIAHLTGDLVTVRERGRQANALDPEARLSEPPWLVLLASMAEAEGGRGADARRGLDLAARDHQGDDLDIFSQFRRWGEAVLAWSEDRLGVATRELVRAVGHLSAMPAPAIEAYLLADLVEVAVAAGEKETAAWAAERTEEIARQIDAPSYQALHQFAMAWVLLAGGQHQAAAAAASRAADGLGGSGLLLLQARARVACARAVRMADRRRATEELCGAIATFDAAGAVLRRERARRLLGQMRSTGRRAAATSGGPALTGREEEIARLAARGLTARQIAERLQIGVRTVETHLARIYPKLGVASKQQLISRGAELGLLSTG